MSVSEIVLEGPGEEPDERLQNRLVKWFNRHSVPESAVIMITALIVGIGAGLGAVVFRILIDGVQNLSYDWFGSLFSGGFPYHLFIVPAVGGLIVGPLIYFFAREAKGHGVPEVMEAVALKGGRIRPIVAVVKSLASAVCIGTGGSVGREGPIAQIGSALGSTIGQFLKLSDDKIRNLVACGAAGGIAATFKAPIAGSIFAMEVILGGINTVHFGAVVISAVTASVVCQAFEGNLRAFAVPEYTLVSPWELVFYTLLGLIAALLAFGFTRMLYFSEDMWEKIKMPEYLKPVLGGVLLGAIGYLTYKVDGFPRVFGVGYNTIGEVLFGKLGIQMVLVLFAIKLLATMTTLGSGGSGGVFAPSLFMGAMVGSGFGQLMNQLFPTITAPSGAYALVGMAAFFSGAAHAPITAILILFEMTGDYRIILPLMLATVMSTLISRIISSDSIYTLKLSRRGVHLEQGHDIDVMQGVSVGEVMCRKFDVVQQEMPLNELYDAFIRTHTDSYPVVDRTGNLVGMVTLRGLENFAKDQDFQGKTTSDVLISENIVAAYPDMPMWKVLKKLGQRNVSCLPVLVSHDNNKMVGVIDKNDIVQAYNTAISKKARKQEQEELLRLGKIDGTSLVEMEIPDNAAVIGKRIMEIHLPKSCLIVSIRRGRNLLIGNGYTVLQSGDRVTAYTDQESLEDLKVVLTTDTYKKPDRANNPVYQEVKIDESGFCAGKMVKDLSLPGNCILSGIQRGGQMIVPHGGTKLLAGDTIEVFGIEEDVREVIALLSQ